MQGGPPDSLNSRHRIIMRMKACGATNIEIGEAVGMHPNRVGTICGSQLFKDEMEKMRLQIEAGFTEKMAQQPLDATKLMNENSGKAAEKLIDAMMSAESEKVRFAAACEVLDRTGHKAVEKHEISHTVLATEGLEQMLLRNSQSPKGPNLQTQAPLGTLEPKIETPSVEIKVNV